MATILNGYWSKAQDPHHGKHSKVTPLERAPMYTPWDCGRPRPLWIAPPIGPDTMISSCRPTVRSSRLGECTFGDRWAQNHYTARIRQSPQRLQDHPTESVLAYRERCAEN